MMENETGVAVNVTLQLSLLQVWLKIPSASGNPYSQVSTHKKWNEVRKKECSQHPCAKKLGQGCYANVNPWYLIYIFLLVILYYSFGYSLSIHPPIHAHSHLHLLSVTSHVKI